ncbi:hypothetical protein LL254_16030 [Marinobacter nauticus]|uniref:hypothetical protein n=1 Tax=Marinobacter nauticus TaxID=2743 RepID=UPI001D19166B|nr:hypothetical protein [Marinobacter nauticus]MCC4272217.1 hypothetical protein [Marinobacter nauticus]
MSKKLNQKNIDLLNKVIWPDGSTAYDQGYRFLKDVANSLGFKNYNSFWKYVKRKGYVYYEELLSKQKMRKANKKAVGRINIPDSVLCDIFKVRYITYRVRLKRGLTKRQALGLDPFLDARTLKGNKKSKESKMIKREKSEDYRKKSSQEIKISEICERVGISESELRRRLETGETVRQAFDLEPESGIEFEVAKAFMYPMPLDIGFKVGDFWYRSVDQFARLWGIPSSRVRRLRKEGVQFEDIPNWSNKRNPGLYSPAFFNSDRKSASKVGRMYLVSLTLKGRSLIKVGITAGSVEERIASFKGPKKVLAEFEGRLKDCYQTEQSVLVILTERLGPGAAKEFALDGKTEMFSDAHPGNAHVYLNEVTMLANKNGLRQKWSA